MYCKKYLSFEYILVLQKKKKKSAVRDEREAIAALSRFNGFASKLLQAAGVSGYEQLAVKCRKGFSTNLRF